jgi:hypothetical protein
MLIHGGVVQSHRPEFSLPCSRSVRASRRGEVTPAPPQSGCSSKTSMTITKPCTFPAQRWSFVSSLCRIGALHRGHLTLMGCQTSGPRQISSQRRPPRSCGSPSRSGRRDDAVRDGERGQKLGNALPVCAGISPSTGPLATDRCLSGHAQCSVRCWRDCFVAGLVAEGTWIRCGLAR